MPKLFKYTATIRTDNKVMYHAQEKVAFRFAETSHEIHDYLKLKYGVNLLSSDVVCVDFDDDDLAIDVINERA